MLIRHSLIFILTIVFLGSCKSQPMTQLSITFSLTRPDLDKVDSIETENGGIRIFKPYTIGVSKDYFPNADKFDLEQPLLYIRDTAKLRTGVSYFFSKPDSTIRLVEYSWDASKEINEIERLFHHNKEVISQLLGQPGKETINNQQTWSQKTIIWQNDSVYVMQFMLIEGEPSRTRVLISWKK